MGEHLSLLRPTFPPMMAILAQVARVLPLDLLAAVRLLPALADAALIVLTALICRTLGGGRRAQILAAVAVLVAPLFLRAGMFFHPVVFEQLWWTLALLALAKLLAGSDRRWWLGLGAALGLGALTKFSVAFLAAGVAVAVVLSPLRRDLGTRWPWIAIALAALLALPTMLGQLAWGWPFLVQARRLQATQLGHFSRLEFLTGQFLLLGPGAPLWLVGLIGLATRDLRTFRALGLLALVVLLLLLVSGGKDYYYGPVHPLLIAAAYAVLGGRSDRRAGFVIALGWFALAGLALLPMGVPILSPGPMARYAAALGLSKATRTNYGTTLALPQDYADMTGWREQVETVAAVYRALPADDQRRAVIYAINYGRAGALALYGRELGLPYPISRHGDFWFWGTRGLTGDVTLIVGASLEDERPHFDTCVEAARSRNRWGVDEEQDVPILICRGPHFDFATMFRERGPYWG